MKIIFTLLTALLFLPLFSQQIDLYPTAPKPGRFEAGIVMSPCISYRTLVNHDTSSTGPSIIGLRNKNERPKTGYKTGISLKYALTEKAGITTGIYFANRGFKHKEENAHWPAQEDINGIFIIPTTTSTIKSIYTFRFIEVPFIVDYTFHKSKLSYSIGIGGSYNYFLGASFSYKITEDNGDIQQASSKHTGPYHQANVSMILKAGVSYSLNENTVIHIDPTFQYDVTELLENVLVNEHLWNLGLHIGYFRVL